MNTKRAKIDEHFSTRTALSERDQQLEALLKMQTPSSHLDLLYQEWSVGCFERMQAEPCWGLKWDLQDRVRRGSEAVGKWGPQCFQFCWAIFSQVPLGVQRSQDLLI